MKQQFGDRVEEIEAAQADALLLGTGFIRISRDEEGNMHYERVAPERVVLHD